MKPSEILAQKAIPKAQQFFDQGMALYEQGHLQQAIGLLEQALGLLPHFFDAVHILGIIAARQNRLTAAISYMKRAIAINPNVASVHNNLGQVLDDWKDYEGAIASFNKALALNPNYVQALINRGDTYVRMMQYQAAIASYQQAITVSGGTAKLYHQLSSTQFHAKQWSAALNSIEQAISLAPTHSEYHYSHAMVLTMLGDNSRAIAALRTMQSLGGDAEVVNFHLAKLGVGKGPSTAPVPYVVTLFDDFAPHFEADLIHQLQYQAHALVAAQVRIAFPQGGLDILDLGCGTGLVGAELAAGKRLLVGVDLSAKMIAKAQEKNIYDSLVQAPIETYLANHLAGANPRRFHAVVAADVFIYIGALESLFQAVHSSLIVGGFLVFSLEISSADNYYITSSGRYAHSPAYIQTLAQKTGFTVSSMQQHPLRLEQGVATQGLIVALQKI